MENPGYKEKLIISNFLNLKDIELDLAKINIIIGPQAQGKSIVAKLVFFFKDFWLNYRSSILEQQRKNKFDKQIIEQFKEIFPEYSWNLQEFKIVYKFSEYQISLHTKKLSSSKSKLVLDYSEFFSKKRRRLIDSRKKYIEAHPKEETQKLLLMRDSYDFLNQQLSKYILDDKDKQKIEEPIFIPAGRSFFSNLQENIFSFLVAKLSIDYFLAMSLSLKTDTGHQTFLGHSSFLKASWYAGEQLLLDKLRIFFIACEKASLF